MHSPSGLDKSVSSTIKIFCVSIYLETILGFRRMQTYVKSHANAPKPSVLSVMRFAIEEAGIRSLYTGLTASLLRQMSYSLVRIGIYEDSKRRLRQRGQATDLKLLCSAGVAGAIGGVAGNPAGGCIQKLYVYPELRLFMQIYSWYA